MFKIYDEVLSPNEGGCLICDEPLSPKEGGVFKIRDEPFSPNEGRVSIIGYTGSAK